jgi:hypothetical protein
MTSIVHTCMFSLGGPDDPQVEIEISVDENGLATVSVVQDTNYPITGALIAFYIEFPGTTDYTGSGLIDLTTNNDIGNMSGAEPANGGVWDSGYLIDGTPPPDEQGPVQFQFQLTGDWQNIDWEQVEVGLQQD